MKALVALITNLKLVSEDGVKIPATFTIETILYGSECFIILALMEYLQETER
jgi:hypothetical protein